MDGYICENGTTVPIFPEPNHSQHWFHIRNHLIMLIVRMTMLIIILIIAMNAMSHH